ncbi:MAG: tRNA modification GTPase [Alphaproteobacteria bacterium]|jgi:tRNA modification GTPase
METIYALSSAPGRAGVAIIRASGAGASAVYSGLAGREPAMPRAAVRVQLVHPVSGDLLDDGLALWFPAPRSYTGESVVEFHVHGGVAVIAAVLDAIGAIKGTRPAEPGEFTRRAFLAGKIDLTGAEGVIDLIDAETDAQRRQALRQASGALGAVYESWRGRLIRVLAHFEAVLDFPEEELPESLMDQIKSNILLLRSEISQHLDDNRRGERLRQGVRVAIMGPPNAGKSTLMNFLAARDVAIVSEIAGTTRDVIETHLDLEGMPVTVLDTAGIRESSDTIEVEGVRRALRAAEEADLRILVLDSSKGVETGSFQDRVDAETIVLWNKVDLGREAMTSVFDQTQNYAVSVHTGEGVDLFLEGLTGMVREMLGIGAAPLLTRSRHRAALVEVRDSLDMAQSALLPELCAEDIRLAVRALGRITGSVDVEELLDVVFRDFCIGK